LRYDVSSGICEGKLLQERWQYGRVCRNMAGFANQNQIFPLRLIIINCRNCL
jgi:hypothetical protein